VNRHILVHRPGAGDISDSILTPTSVLGKERDFLANQSFSLFTSSLDDLSEPFDTSNIWERGNEVSSFTSIRSDSIGWVDSGADHFDLDLSLSSLYQVSFPKDGGLFVFCEYNSSLLLSLHSDQVINLRYLKRFGLYKN
jgi:hypothetical protein